MASKMLINASSPEELRVALVEDGRLEAFYVETAAAEQTRGNIYKGVVTNVEPSLQAAFIDFGRGKNGFMQIGDLRNDLWGDHKPPAKGLPPLQDVLKKGRELLVQVVKEESGNKGAALTTHISLPGQYLVLTPGHDHCGVSRKIENEKERTRIKKTLDSIERPSGLGVIARTAAENRGKRELTTNYKQLARLWEDIEKRGKSARAPSLIHKEEELALRAVRDLFTSDLTEVMVDNAVVYDRLLRFAGLVSPRRKNIVKLYQQSSRPIFSKYQLEEQITSVYQPQVRLPSGGTIVISPTEALVAVDVNSGKSSKGKEFEQTALEVNSEAAVEIARQLRLRDLGGLIVIDFIDMRDRSNQRKVRKALVDSLKKDKAKTTVGLISRFGLLEMSRQRIRPAIDFGDTRLCPMCQGRGMVRSTEAVGRQVLRALELKIKGISGSGARLVLAPATANHISNARRAELARLEAASGVCLEVTADPALAPDQMRLEDSDASWPLPAAPAAAAKAEVQAKVEEQPEADAPSKRSKPPRKRRPRPQEKKNASPAEQSEKPKPNVNAAETPAAKRRRRRPSGAQRRARARAKAKAQQE